jgi:hypothetical protein
MLLLLLLGCDSAGASGVGSGVGRCAGAEKGDGWGRVMERKVLKVSNQVVQFLR